GPEQPAVPAATKSLQDLALFPHALISKTSPDRFDHRSASAGSALILWSLDDARCSAPHPEKTTRESSCWLRCGGNCCRGARRRVGRVAAAVELGLGLPRYETVGSFVRCSPWSRARAPRQGFALRVRGRPHCPRRCCGRPGPDPTQLRSWHRPLA